MTDINMKKLGKYAKKKADSFLFRSKSYVQGKMNQHDYMVRQGNEKLKGFLDDSSDTMKRRFRINVTDPVKKFMGNKKVK